MVSKCNGKTKEIQYPGTAAVHNVDVSSNVQEKAGIPDRPGQ